MPAPQTPVTPQYQPQYQQLISQSATPQSATSMMADMKSLKELIPKIENIDETVRTINKKLNNFEIKVNKMDEKVD